MVLIALGEPNLALAAGTMAGGRRRYVRAGCSDVALRHAVHEAQPAVVLLDVTLGRGGWSAMAQIPKLLAVRSAPAIVLLAPRRSKHVETVAAAWGCYDVIIRGRDDAATAKTLAAKVNEARRWHDDQLYEVARALGTVH